MLALCCNLLGDGDTRDQHRNVFKLDSNVVTTLISCKYLEIGKQDLLKREEM